MQTEVTKFKQLCANLAEHRRISVGDALDTSFLSSWPGDIVSEAEFGELVSLAYQLWKETWRPDVGFLLAQTSNDDAAHVFDKLIYDLRTAIHHSDNEAAEQSYRDWAKDACGGRHPDSRQDWDSVGTALMSTFNAAMNVLCSHAVRGREFAFRAAWAAKVSNSPEEIVLRVANDLGMRLDHGQRDYHVRVITRRWSGFTLRPGQVASDVLESFAEQSLLSRVGRIPCPYQDVLDELRVLGTPRAVGALHLAHAVFEVTNARGEAYFKLLKATWTMLHTSANLLGVCSLGRHEVRWAAGFIAEPREEMPRV